MTMYTVRFQPVDVEIAVHEDETVLDAAFRQGVMLMHGCREGQCSACKSRLLDGDAEMEKYSTFALPEFERDEGYVLLCRCHPYSDLEIELLNYDEDLLRSEVRLQTVQTTVEAIEPLTHDIRRLVLKVLDPAGLVFKAGQYVDIRLPGSTEHRSYSIANTPSTNDRLEFMIKLYPGGRFSNLLESELSIGQRLEVTGPYGSCTLRETANSDIICIGGGSGMAPLWSIVNDMAERGIQRKTTLYYAAKTQQDLFYLDRMQQLAERLPGFRFVPVLSRTQPGGEWDGETGRITEVVDRTLAAGQTTAQAYLCGPAPMIDAVLPVLARKGISEDRTFLDKFTPSGSSSSEPSTSAIAV
jgi:propane monooxygenase reductase subunit